MRTVATPSEFVHRFIPASQEALPTLLLLHGTGGDENDLLPLGGQLAAGAAMLSPRGKVLENGMPRFFRRLAQGVFDLDDLRFRAHELASFVNSASARYNFDPHRIVAVGYSNGANIATSMLFLHPSLLAGAILFRPSIPFIPDPVPDLAGVPVFIGAGRFDQFAPLEESERLAALLREAQAAVTLHWQSSGHAITSEDVEAGREWLTRDASVLLRKAQPQ
jgi:phospholipase/carboxylesterase/glyoxalase family protein